MTNPTQNKTLDDIISALRKSHGQTTQGFWAKGSRINNTVAITDSGDKAVAEFRRVDDAQFCDLAHAFLPRVLDEIKSLQDKVLELTLKNHEHNAKEKETSVIVNLTQHLASTEQVQAGVVDLPEDRRAALLKALTFDEIPSIHQIVEAAEQIVDIAFDNGLGEDGGSIVPKFAMIAGAPWLLSTLENELHMHGITPVYAFSVRTSEETVQPDGSTKKTNVFRHKGFVYF